MKLTVFVGGIVLVAVLLYLLGRVAVRAWLQYRGTRVITCPETEQPAAVDVDVKQAVLGAVKGGSEHRLKDCSRWPERQACGQECLEQVEASPHDCLLQTILTDWYRGRSCALCGTEFGEIHWHDHKPALLDTQGATRQWSDFAPEMIPATLESHRPICWDCHVAERFREQRPDLVTERERRQSPASD